MQAIVLAGGSAIGLRCVDGVVRFLLKKNRGFKTHSGIVPIVPAAAIFDLGVGDSKTFPDAIDGYNACLDAFSKTHASHSGNIGVGTGAIVGKIAGYKHAMRGGLGNAVVTCRDGLVVGVLVVVNALGDIINPKNGNLVAGARVEGGEPLITNQFLYENNSMEIRFGNTTLAVVVTNANLSKAEVTQVARMAQGGVCKAISPSHSPYDGDTVFAVSAGDIKADVLRVGSISSDLMVEAILDAVFSAQSAYGIPCAKDVKWTDFG